MCRHAVTADVLPGPPERVGPLAPERRFTLDFADGDTYRRIALNRP